MTTTESRAIRPADLALMANLPSRLSGLPMSVWAQERGDARHHVRIKVNPPHGHRIDYRHLVPMLLRPQPHVIAPGHLTSEDQRPLSAWVCVHGAVVVAYLDGRIYSDELLERLERLD